MEQRHSRRVFVEKASSVLKIGALVQALHVFRVDAAPLINPAIPKTEFSSIDDYMEYVEVKKAEVLQTVEAGDILGSIKNLSPEQKMEDFNTYFPMYLAAQIKYEVPWYLMWIMHEAETSASRTVMNDLYLGAMQRGKQKGALYGSVEHDPQRVEEAAEGFEFLRFLPQRQQGQTKNDYTWDYKELLWGAWHIRSRADNPEFYDMPYIAKHSDPLEDRIKYIVEWKYSAQRFGKQRKERYETLSNRGGLRIETP
jgi:hypothetical protein